MLNPKEHYTKKSTHQINNEFIFQKLTKNNIQTLTHHKIHKIVTHYPHYLNNLQQNYPQFNNQYKIIHHTQLLTKLTNTKKLPQPTNTTTAQITYHNPYYLTHINNITKPPHQLIQITIRPQTTITEIPHHNQKTTYYNTKNKQI